MRQILIGYNEITVDRFLRDHAHKTKHLVVILYFIYVHTNNTHVGIYIKASLIIWGIDFKVVCSHSDFFTSTINYENIFAHYC